MVYALPAEELPVDPIDRVREALTLVRRMEPSGNLLVMKTAPGNAQPLARAFDVADLTQIAGDVAGDDTVLLVAREPYTGTDLQALCNDILQGKEINA
jgi:transcriptional regulator of arginine metabolism